MAADDALMQQCATAHYACKLAAMVTRELTCPDLWSTKKMTFRTSAVTELLCYFTYLQESNSALLVIGYYGSLSADGFAV